MKEIKKLILVSSVIVCLVLLIEAFKDNIYSEWRTYQDKYIVAMLKTSTTDMERNLARNYSVKMRQIVLPELDRSDRCVSCHVGMEDPRMVNMPNPLKTHPGNYLETHDVEKVGCTVCHDGQGRALTAKEAHANEHGLYWEQPLLKGALIQANCSRCHSTEIAENDQYNRGKELFEKNDCRRCHKESGKGGGIGPDLSEITVWLSIPSFLSHVSS
ncbi:MAG: c-type cytochrome, partial [Nitrospirae bacterium]|nr:c-type cytochrome [Nitrospirota bacterium]